MKKVLIIYTAGGMGHVTAAKAIYEVFCTKYPEIEARNINALDYSNKLFEKVFVEGYNLTSAKAPKIWGWLYKHFDNQRRQKIIKMIIKSAVESKLIAYIKEFKPDFIISTHPLPMQLVSYSKKKEIIDILSAMVVTDFGCHSLWVDSAVNYYFVADEIVKKCLAGHGVNPDKIIVTGIPIEPKFARPQNKAELQKKFSLDSGRATILIVGGQLPFSVLKQVINSVLSQAKAQFLVVAGRDKNLEKQLTGWNVDKNMPVKVFGFVNNLEELMTASDMIFTKAGGLTMSECLAKNLPIIIGKIIPGQEQDNVNFLVAKGAALKTSSPADISQKIIGLISEPEKLEAMKKASENLGKPEATENLVDFVVDKIK